MMWVQEQGFRNGFWKLAFHFDNKEVSHKELICPNCSEIPMIRRHCCSWIYFVFWKIPRQGMIQIYELQFPPMDGAASLTFLFQLPSIEVILLPSLILDFSGNADWSLVRVQGTVLDLKFLADSFWKLEEADGRFSLSHHSLDRWESNKFPLVQFVHIFM